MVFFTCNACGESLKKVQVDKHVQICRGCEVLSCIDCGADFWGESYRSHVRCISEDQKYGGKGFEAKANKGDVKQQQWINKVQVALSKPGLSSSLKNVLQQVATYDNVPRKKNKFQNWMKNSLKIHNNTLHEQVWNILSEESSESSPAEAEEKTEQVQTKEVKATENGSHKKQTVVDSSSAENGLEKKKLNKRERKEARRQKKRLKTEPDQNQDQNINQEQNQEPEASGKQKKRKRKEENGPDRKKTKKESKEPEVEDEAEVQDEAEEPESQPKGKFNWKGNIKSVLRASPDQELSVKKLRKKVLAAYLSFTSEHQKHQKSEEEVLALFNRKINKNPKFRVLKDRVRLIP